MPLDAVSRAALADLVRTRGYERRSEPFVLSAGGTSHDYVDCRHVVATGDALRLVSQAVIDAVDTGWDVVGGPTMGADPIAHGVAMLAGASWFSVRKAAKGHGRGASIEGHRLLAGDRVLAVDDTTSTGTSLLRAVEDIRALGVEVVAATALLDRSPSVAVRLAAAGVPWVPLLTWADIGIEPL